MNAIERVIAHAMWRVLVRRGWAVQLNRPEDCDPAWRPIFSARYGKTPVYRGPGEARWIDG